MLVFPMMFVRRNEQRLPMLDVLPENGVKQFEEFEIAQMNMKNQVLSDEIKKHNEIHPDVDRSIIALSSMRDEVVILCELRGES